ncbi:hypothetical protein KFE25_006869 [Diacronema lutheri]|uniref:Uncharacterized protein n=3 Tax=Diacronema lutheri TaxID=2081491 RepID=A0A8J5XSR8_DIALT|nr:hypothetical protein KFE25_006869 [Diacronema lutheri]
MATPYAPPGMSRDGLSEEEEEHDEQAFAPPRLQSVQPAYDSVSTPAQPLSAAYAEYSPAAQLVQPSDVHNAQSSNVYHAGSYAPMDGSSITFQPPPPRAQLPPTLSPHDDEMAAMVSTIQSFALVPVACSACGPAIALLVSSALGGGAWKTGVLSGMFVSVGLSTVTIYGTVAGVDASTSGVPQPLAMLCSDDGQGSACRLHSAGMVMRVLLTFALIGAVASTLAATVLALLDANRLAALRAQLGPTGLHALPRIATSCWAATSALLGAAALLYAALSPFRFRETTLVLDASYGTVRLALLLSVLCAIVHARFISHVRPLVASGAFSAAAERGAISERPLEVELGLELVRAYGLLRDRSRPLCAILGAQLAVQLVAIVHAPQWSALLPLAGASAIAYSNHHLASMFVVASSISAGLDLLDLVSGPPLTLSSSAGSAVYMLLLAAVCLKAASAVLVSHLDERSGSGYSAFLLPAEGR